MKDDLLHISGRFAAIFFILVWGGKKFRRVRLFGNTIFPCTMKCMNHECEGARACGSSIDTGALERWI